MDDKLKSTIDKIIRLTQSNPEFSTELRKALKMEPSAKSVSGPSDIKDDVLAIRQALEIRANVSISYDFIKQQRLRDQLIIDNLRMENAALDLREEESTRFYVFCVNAFYQIENVVNYYFHSLYPKIDNLLTCIESNTQNEEEKFRFKRNPKSVYRSVGDIAIADKLNAICNILFPGDNIKITYSQLRMVRNEGAHRCQIIYKDENESLHKFFKFNTFNSIRIALIKLVSSIKTAIEDLNKVQVYTGCISSILPSACYIKVNDQTMPLPINLLKGVKGKNKGEEVKVQVQNGKIVGLQ